MEKRVAVLHEHQLAQYDVKQTKNGRFIARLFSYNGNSRNTPPLEIEMYKEGRHWQDDGASQDLVDDIGFAIEDEGKAANQPVFHNRSPEEGTREEGRDIGGGRP